MNTYYKLSFPVALVFGIRQIKDAKRERRDSLTLKTLADFQSREFSELMFYVVNHSLPVTRKEVLALPDNEQIMII